MTVGSPQEKWVDVPGGRVWTRTYGTGRRPALLVLHGGPGMPAYYLEGLSALAAEHDVVLFDQLGCGRSERPNDPELWTVARAVAEVDAVRSGLDLGTVSLLGHSWGGFLAVAYTLAHPANVSAIILSSPLVSVEQWMTDAASLIDQMPPAARSAILLHEAEATFDHPDYQDATMAFYKRFFCKLDPWPDNLERTFREMGEQPYNVMWGPSEFTQTGNLRGEDLSPALSDISVPSLWVCGTQDEVIPGTLEGFARRAGGRLCVVDGGTHCLHLEQPDVYLRTVGSFLGQV